MTAEHASQMTQNHPIHTFEDILDVLGSNPRLRDQMRRHLLTEELLALPATVAQLAATLQEFMVATQQRFEQVEQRLDRIETRLDHIDGRLDKMDGRLDKMDGRLDKMDGRLDKMDGRLDRGFGHNYEQKVAAHVGSIAGQSLRLRRTRLLKSVMGADAVFTEQIEGSEDNGRITAQEHDELGWLDLIFNARSQQDQAHVLVAAEISITAHADDIERAATRAGILAKATGQTVIPAVVTSRIAAEQEELAASKGVSIMYCPDD